MTYDEALEQLAGWVRSSAGAPIPLPSGESYAFVSDGPVSAEGIRAVEETLGVAFPESYREFLLRVGPGAYFLDRYEMGCVFHAPDRLQAHSAEVFATRADPFPRLLLVASLSGGAEGGFYLTRPGPNHFSVFTTDEAPDEWGRQTESWTAFEDWMIRLVRSSGDDIYP